MTTRPPAKCVAVWRRELAINGDASKTVAAIIDAASGEAPPFRLALGSKAYRSINEALNSRLQVLEDTRALALSVDKDA
jgi:hypothetical protein